MIDIENEVFSEVAKKLRAKYSKIFVTGEYVKSPPSFPCVSIVEIDNAVYRRTQTTSYQENHVAVTYEVNVYSNKTKGKKAECKEIIGLIDETLMSLNFNRTMLEPVPNQADATIYRMLGRYRALVSKDKMIYRR